MKILNEKPPEKILNGIFGAGMAPNLGNVIFTHGDTIYNPSGRDVPDYLIAHESIHTIQQGDDPDAWWERYLRDPYFRLQQETEGYAVQFAFICNKVKDRNQRFKILLALARSLSGPTYGSMIGHSAAMKMIKERSKVKP